MNSVLKKLQGKADQAEVYHLHSRSVPVTFRSGKLESIKVQESEGLALRVIKSGRLGFGSSTDVQDPSALIDAALAAAAYGDQAGFSFPSVAPTPRSSTSDPTVVAMRDEELIAIGEAAIRRLGKADPGASVNVILARSVDAVSVSNTSGLSLEEERTSVGVSVEIEKASADDIFLLGDATQARYLKDLRTDEIVDRLIEQLHLGQTIVPVRSGNLPLVFTPNGAFALLLPLFSGFSGRSVYMGTSPLKGRVGERVFDSRVSIADDGTLARAVGTAAFDDEGMPTERTALTTNGVVKGFLYDLRTAALAGARSTGNGRKASPFGDGSFRMPPGVGMTNFVVSPGKTPHHELIASIDEGIMVEAVLGLGQGNVQAGDFSNNVAVGFKIEKGNLVGRVKNTMISGNVYSLLKDHLIGLGDRASWAFGFINTPSVAVSDVAVVA